MKWIMFGVVPCLTFAAGSYYGIKSAARNIAQEFRRDHSAVARALVGLAGRDQERRLIRMAHR